MAHGPDHDDIDDGPSIQRGEERPTEAAGPSTGRPARAAVGLGILVALVAGGLVGFMLGRGVGDGDSSDNPDLRALCIMVGTVDDAALDRLGAGESSLDDPLMFRVSAIPPLAQAASRGDGAPDGLAEVAAQFNQRATRLQLDDLPALVEELRTYC